MNGCKEHVWSESYIRAKLTKGRRDHILESRVKWMNQQEIVFVITRAGWTFEGFVSHVCTLSTWWHWKGESQAKTQFVAEATGPQMSTLPYWLFQALFRILLPLPTCLVGGGQAVIENCHSYSLSVFEKLFCHKSLYPKIDMKMQISASLAIGQGIWRRPCQSEMPHEAESGMSLFCWCDFGDGGSGLRSWWRSTFRCRPYADGSSGCRKGKFLAPRASGSKDGVVVSSSVRACGVVWGIFPRSLPSNSLL